MASAPSKSLLSHELLITIEVFAVELLIKWEFFFLWLPMPIEIKLLITTSAFCVMTSHGSYLHKSVKILIIPRKARGLDWNPLRTGLQGLLLQQYS